MLSSIGVDRNVGQSRCSQLISLEVMPCKRPRLMPKPPLLHASKQQNVTADGEVIEYKDSWSDVQFINLCRRAYGSLANYQSPRSWKDGQETYKVRCTAPRHTCWPCCNNDRAWLLPQQLRVTALLPQYIHLPLSGGVLPLMQPLSSRAWSRSPWRS